MSLFCRTVLLASDTHFLEKHVQFFFASGQISLQFVSSFDELITRWATIGFEESVVVEEKANVPIATL